MHTRNARADSRFGRFCDKGRCAFVAKIEKRSRYALAHGMLIFWTLFIGFGAVAGAAGMLIDPSGRALGMEAMLPYFQLLPFADILFQDFTFSGAALLIVNGLTNLLAAALLLRRRRSGDLLGGLFGVTLMLWICIQFYIFPLNFMSTAYFIFGLAQALTGYAAGIFRRQEEFCVDPTDYPNVGTDPKRLVVYFSRMGYVKKVAYEAAQRTGAQLCEIRSTERTEGTLGFWWCGRYAMHRWSMPIEEVGEELSAFDHITICAPIWVFSLAAPMRAFCKQSVGRIREADYILVHHTRGSYSNTADAMDALLGITRTSCRSIVCRAGKMLEWK